MAPRLSRPPDPNDPEYQRLENRINLALHVGIFAASISGLWFVRSVTYADWEWSSWLTAVWLCCVSAHGVWVFAREKQLPIQ